MVRTWHAVSTVLQCAGGIQMEGKRLLTSGSLGNCGCPAPPFMTGLLCYKSITKWILYYEGNHLRDRAHVSLTQTEKNTDFFGIYVSVRGGPYPAAICFCGAELLKYPGRVENGLKNSCPGPGSSFSIANNPKL